MTTDSKNSMAIIAGCRTPFSKAGSELARASAADLATHVFREVLDRSGIDPNCIDEVILGCAGPDASEANVARVAALRAGLSQSTPAVTVMRNCASGMESLFAAEMRLRAGTGEVFLVGGSESMSNYPLIYGPDATEFFARLAKARGGIAKLRTIASVRPRFFAPRVAIKDGLTDPVSGLMMGNTAENIARRFGISRSDQDRFALQSHQRAAKSQENGRFDREIAALAAPPKFKALVAQDNGIRDGQTLEALAKLRPVFDRHEGDVTVGNSCQITDGAVALLVMSQQRAKDLGLLPIALIRSHARAALDPAYMGLGPVHATPLALSSANLSLADMDLIEINEAFAAQVLGCIAAFADPDYCRDQLGLEDAMGSIDPSVLNVNGGAISLGHPIAASGARLTLTLAEELRARGKRYGLATLCIGGGQGQALVLEAA